jgi:hypothetical protein
VQSTIYAGKRGQYAWEVMAYTPHKRKRKLPLCLEIMNHSPGGFGWGYSGSGPAQLALAILYDTTGDKDLAFQFHQHYKEEVIAKLNPTAEWEIEQDSVKEWVGLKQAQLAGMV